MPTWLVISVALLLGACQDEVVGGIRQLNTNTQPNLKTSSVDVWVEEDVYSDTTIVADTNPLDTTLEVDTRDVIDTAEAVDTITPDTIEDTVETVDTGLLETVEDTTPIPDTADTVVAVDTTPPECSVHFDCDDHNDCTHDYCVNFSCVHEDNALCVMDSDGDGIVDIEDACPLVPEYFDYFEDDDGCPEADQDHDGYTPLEGDCGDDPSLGNDPASFCWNEYDGYNLRIHFGVGADERPSCDFYLDDELVEAVFFFETNGAFLIGPQVDGGDTPGDGVDQDCDGETDESGEYGLTEPDCYWWSFEDGSEEVSCWWMEFVPKP